MAPLKLRPSDESDPSRFARHFLVAMRVAVGAEVDGAEEGGEAAVDVGELVGGNFLDAAGFRAEGVDDEVEAQAGVALHAGEDFVACLNADLAAMVVAVMEGGAVDGAFGQGLDAHGGGLGGALGGSGSREDGVVEKGTGKSGDGPWIEVDGGDTANVGAAAGGGGFYAEVGEEAVFLLEVPAGGDGEADVILPVGEGAGGSRVGVFGFGGVGEAAGGKVRNPRGEGPGVFVEFGSLLRGEGQGEECDEECEGACLHFVKRRVGWTDGLRESSESAVVGSHENGLFTVLDARTGTVVTQTPCADLTDFMSWDPETHNATVRAGCGRNGPGKQNDATRAHRSCPPGVKPFDAKLREKY